MNQRNSSPRMDTPETKTCPRCGGAFQCREQHVASCECRTVTLAPAAITVIRQNYQGCLCVGCLRALSLAIENERHPAEL
jgi:hypothetical protein